MVIYKKLHWITEEKRIIQLAIDFFSRLRETQKNNVLIIANEYGMTEKARHNAIL